MHVNVESPQPFHAVFARRSLIILVALLLGETTINFIDRQVVSVLAPTLRAEFHLSNGQYAMILNAFLGDLRDRLCVRRLGARSPRRQPRTDARGRLVVGGRHRSPRSRRGPLSLGFFRSAARARRRRRLARLRQSRRDLGPAGGAHAGHRHLQQRLESRRDDRAAAGRVYHPALRLARRFHRHRRARPDLGGGVSTLPEAAPGDGGSERDSRQTGRRRGCAGWICSATARPGPSFVCRFFADPLWYFYVFWIPEFLTRERGLNLAAIGAVAWIPFLVADLSNFAGGYVSLRLQRAAGRQPHPQDDDGHRHRASRRSASSPSSRTRCSGPSD